MPKKWARFCQRTLFCPTSLRKASWTRAVLCRVWPCRSWRKIAAGQTAEFIVDQGSEFLQCLPVALAPVSQQTGDLVLGCHFQKLSHSREPFSPRLRVICLEAIKV